MQHLYLMRHGQSQANADHIIAGSHESPLSPIGCIQAELAGQTASQFFHFDLIITSPMSRAAQTAMIIAEQLNYPQDKIVVVEDLRERNLGNVEGKSYESSPDSNGNYEDAENVPNVEPITDLFDRAALLLEQFLKRPEQLILIITHNGTGRMLRTVAEGNQPMEMYEQPRMENAIIYPLT
jgi:uncharacterized phosphatase